MAPTVPIEFVGQKESKKCWLSQPMGKSRKYSKGHSSCFVPDYRHAVGTERAASEDSYAPKRKSVSLNLDGHDNFGVPIQVLPLSKMSRSERKDLELRLKTEFELVRVLEKKLASWSSNAVTLSPSSDIWSCSDGQKRPPVEGFHRSAEVLAPQSKKRAPPGRNGARPKKGPYGRIEQAKPAAPANTTYAMLIKQCGTLLHRLMTHQFGWVFNEPVDVVKLKIPDYFSVIKHPMDLGTVKSKMASGAYSSTLGFAADVRLTFANALKYNPPGNDVHFMAEALSKFFESRWKAIEKKLPLINGVESVSCGAGAPTQIENSLGTVPSKKKKMAQNDNKVKLEPVRRAMTNEEKHNLSMELEALLAELPESIIEFLKQHSHSADQTGEDEIEIDIDALGDDTLFKLRKLLDDYLLEKRKNQGKAETCEMELHNESGLSNSSVRPCKGNEPGDEDIDIVGGNEPPTSSYPPVEIGKDAAHKNNKCGSSSSSSSESGSPSGDPDSGSSSGSESDAARALGSVTKENMGPGENVDQKKSDLGDPDIGNQSANGLAGVEPDSEAKPTTSETDGHREGESAPPERLVSPDKLYRAAILRRRFADTILKAQEKALEKGEWDPEKLRLEREELERRQKEEKARLLAEARAAEEAQRKAAAEAAAEAKRKREVEREAARRALLELEKNVEINENSQFMEDLEMLRTAHDEELPSFIEETIQGSSNPLEQLGLYMKKDDDEEEEVELPQTTSGVAKDVEEGGID